MPTSGLALITNGLIYPPQEVFPTTAEHPTLTAVIEVRPRILGSIPTPAPAAVDAPAILGAEELKPQMGAEGPDVDATGDTPTVLSAEDLRPTIRKAEEE